MRFTYNWLKDFVEIKIPAKALADKLTMAGLEVTALEEREGDFVFELEVTSNRPDWLSVVGIARETAAITKSKFRAYSVERIAYSKKLSAKRYPLNAKTVQIKIENKKDCPLYTAKIIREVKVGPSPEWLRKRLELIGCRSINNIVDITNYILFTYGQPLHAFDLDKLSDNNLLVRRAKENERLLTIDGQSRFLNSEALVIADKNRPVALAGIIGGKDTEVSEATKNILVEAAIFNPILIRRTRTKLGLQTDSAYRFERGVDIEGVAPASAEAVRLIEELTGGRCVLVKSSSYPKPKKQNISLALNKANKILGVNIPLAKFKKILSNLGFKIRQRGKNNFSVQVPSYRQDVNLEIDLIEELARIEGYALIPKTLPAIRPQVTYSDARSLVSLIKNTLVGLGLNEVITYSLIDRSLSDAFGRRDAVDILNPLSSAQEILRPMLSPSLCRAIAYNLNQKQEYVSIFEIAKAFLQEDNQLKEELVLGIGLCGERPLLLAEGLVKDKAGLLHLKGIWETLAGKLGIKDYSFKNNGEENPIALYLLEERIGALLKPGQDILDKLEIKNQEVFLLEVSLEKVFPYVNLKKQFASLPLYPSITRDISLILKENIGTDAILQAIKERGGLLLEEAKVIDYYQGKQIPAGYRGLTISCLYRCKERTLTEREVQPLHSLVSSCLTERFDARLR